MKPYSGLFPVTSGWLLAGDFIALHVFIFPRYFTVSVRETFEVHLAMWSRDSGQDSTRSIGQLGGRSLDLPMKN